MLAAEELAWGDVSGAMALLAPNLVAIPVLLCGTAEQKRELLPRFCGDAYAAGSAALLEPRYDFDPHALRTRAHARERRLRALRGRSRNVPCAADAEWMLVYARARRGHPGLPRAGRQPGAPGRATASATSA